MGPMGGPYFLVAFPEFPVEKANRDTLDSGLIIPISWLAPYMAANLTVMNPGVNNP